MNDWDSAQPLRFAPRDLLWDCLDQAATFHLNDVITGSATPPRYGVLFAA